MGWKNLLSNRASSAASLEATALGRSSASLEHEMNGGDAVRCERLPAVVDLTGTSL